MPVEVFGAGAVQTAYVSYLSFDLTRGDVVLVWPTSYVDVPREDLVTGINYNVLAASMTVTNAKSDLSSYIILPNAMQSSVGQNFIITNNGPEPFDLLTSDENLLTNVDVGISYWVQLTDNTTAVGEWKSITFGAGTSAADAVALSGYGLTALGNPAILNTNIPSQIITADPRLNASNRATLFVWKGGTATIALPSIVTTIPNVPTVPSGYYVAISNQQPVDLTITPSAQTQLPAQLIDGEASLIIQEGETATLVAGADFNWYTLGLGRVSNFPTILIKNGGTDATTPEDAIKNLMPGASNSGCMVYWNGLKWATLDSPNNNAVLTIVNGVPTWLAPTVLSAAGSIPYWNGTQFIFLTPPTRNSILTMSNGVPSWTSVPPDLNPGAILYWNGTTFVFLAPTADGNSTGLTLVAGVPTWL